jgi:hypothetical protein
MGQVKVFVELTNTTDLDNCQSKIISEQQIRAHSTQALIDTGAVLSI